MKKPRHFQSRLVGLTVGVILALLIWPATGWLVRCHLQLAVPTAGRVAPWVVGGSNVNAMLSRFDRNRETAARHGEDFDLQLAAAVSLPPTDGPLTSHLKVERLRSLAQRFPGRPTLYAAILRLACANDIHIRRDEEAWLTGETAKPAAAKEAYNTPEQLALFDLDAAEGERLDPDNAYFPLMRAAALFAAHRDEDALAAIQRASAKPAWVEYYGDEVKAEWKLHEETYGKTGMMPRTAIAWAILFPHYGQLRSLGRVAATKAAQAEMTGQVEEGLAIREALGRCARLIRLNATSAIGGLIGRQMMQTAMSRPGGAPALPLANDADTQQIAGERLRAYTAFLRQSHHADQAVFAEAEADAGLRLRRMLSATIQTSPLVAPRNLALLWIAALVPLSAALWMFALGGLAALLARHRSIRSGKGWARGAHPTWVFGLLAGGSLILATMNWQASESTGVMMELIRAASEGDAQAASTLGQAVTMAIPCLTLLVLGGLSLLWRVPLSVGVIRGLRGIAVPMACVLLLGYAVLVPFIARQEAVLEEALNRTLQHEGKYLAELAGQKWPE